MTDGGGDRERERRPVDLEVGRVHVGVWGKPAAVLRESDLGGDEQPGVGPRLACVEEGREVPLGERAGDDDGVPGLEVAGVAIEVVDASVDGCPDAVP